MLRNLLCRIGIHQWNYVVVPFLSTKIECRMCKNCLKQQELIYWYGTLQGTKTIVEGSLRK